MSTIWKLNVYFEIIINLIDKIVNWNTHKHTHLQSICVFCDICTDFECTAEAWRA